MSDGRRALLGLVAGLVAACGAGDDAIVGTWRAEAPTGETAVLAFEEDGTASWRIGSGPRSGPYAIAYAFDGSADPAALDLSGFEEGPLAGHTLYCIVDLPDAATLRLDCAPGPADDDAVRPTSFGRQTQTYTRVTGAS